ncbi:MAG: 50S ribosomal protein L4 [Bacteriovoracaceae bacterium]|nr:50S ribosomal protein L4 [Bacteriovoracaceae bacterium]
MADIAILDGKFNKKSSLTTKVDLEKVSEAIVHQVVKATLAGRRQGTAATKTKAMVSGGGKKPFKQKGTGNARQGSNRSPLMVGGGTAFGPTPRDYTQKINKKVMLGAIRSIIADKFLAQKLTVVEGLDFSGKTKEAHQILSSKNLLPALLVLNQGNEKGARAVRNLQHANALLVDAFSVYEAVKYENLIFEKEAFESLLTRLESLC